MAHDQKLILVYVDAHGALTRRVIQSLRIEGRGSRRYLWAQTGPGQPERCFRVDRIISLTLTQ